MDSTQLYHDKSSDCWISIWVILDFDPAIQYKKKHVMPGAFIPGPNNLKNMESFLFPGFHHISAIQKARFKVWDASVNLVKDSSIFFYLGEYLSKQCHYIIVYPCWQAVWMDQEVCTLHAWLATIEYFVKNGFSDLTKVQLGQGQHRIDIMNDHWEKTLKESCHERNSSDGCVFNREE